MLGKCASYFYGMIQTIGIKEGSSNLQSRLKKWIWFVFRKPKSKVCHVVRFGHWGWCGPRIFNDAFPLDRRDSLFVYLGEKYDFQKRLGVATYFYLFLKGKTSKNKTPKWTPDFFGKAVCEKPESGFGDQVTYWEGTVKTVAPL